MGWTSAATIAGYVIIEGPDDGLFVYNGTPAKGSLIASIASAKGTDPYGNAYLSGVCSYYPGVNVYYALQHSGAELIWYTATTYAGPWTQDSLINLISSGHLLLQAGVTQFYLSSSPYITVPLAALNGVTQAGPEGWHQATGLPSGFTGSVNYQLLATGRVALSVDLSIAASTSISHGETLATLQSGYYSTLAGKFILVTLEDNGVYSPVPLQVTTTGNIAWMSDATTTSGTSALLGEATIAVNI